MQQIGEIAKKYAHKDKKGKEQPLAINAIPNNMEKYMAFMLGNHLTFIESFQFMSSSLHKLVSNLPKEALKYTSKEFTGIKLSLMSQKGVYPYDHMDSFEKFDQMQLPTKDQFYSVLNDNILRTLNTTMQRGFGRPLTFMQWVNIMTYTLRVTCSC